jgi:hypothetical protein
MYYTRPMDTLTSFQAIIDAFGGPTKYAEAIGVPGFHAQSMKNRDSIPPAYWDDTVSAAAARQVEGVTLERLAILAKAKRPTTESAV